MTDHHRRMERIPCLEGRVSTMDAQRFPDVLALDREDGRKNTKEEVHHLDGAATLVQDRIPVQDLLEYLGVSCAFQSAGRQRLENGHTGLLERVRRPHRVAL